MGDSLKFVYKAMLKYNGSVIHEATFDNSINLTISWRPNYDSQRYINSYIGLKHDT